MPQKYYVDNLISRFIKCLLWDTYIPTVDIWKPGKSIIKGFTYVTNDGYIVKAKQDWKPVNGLEGPKSALNDKFFKVISNYIEGAFYRGITSNFESNSALYDSDTHYMLGQYLRSIRDLHNLDLMPYYNCFSGIASNKIRILNDSSVTLENTNNDGLVSYIVPIKMNKDYSIYYESDVPYKILPVYYDGISVTLINSVKYTKVSRSSLRDPYIFNFSASGDEDIFQSTTSRLLEDYLVLLVQVPKNKYSNLVVLEGNYKDVKINLNNTPGNPSINKLSPMKLLEPDSKELEEGMNNLLKPLSSLTLNIGDTNYAFSDRLIEYLLYSPIINKDRVRYNIERIQRYLSSNKAKEEFRTKYELPYIKDVWDNNLRYYIYNLVTQSIDTPLYKDINGFVDKDTEFIIDKARVSKEV